jgi:hypothetical protein
LQVVNEQDEGHNPGAELHTGQNRTVQAHPGRLAKLIMKAIVLDLVNPFGLLWPESASSFDEVKQAG